MSGENGTEETTLEPPYTDVEPWLRGVHSFVATSLMIASVLGNVLVLWVVAKNKELQYRSILASMGAVAVNILFSVTTNPQVLAGSITGEWPFTQSGCVALGFISTSIFYVRWINSLLIAVDRFLYIITPFFYQRVSKWMLVVMTVVVWTLPFLSNAPSAIRGTYSYRSSLTFCAVDCLNDDLCTLSYTIIFTGYLFIGMLCPMAIYIFLYCFGKKKRRDMNRELGTQTHNSRPCSTSNGHVSSDHYVRPSCDLTSIIEEDETVSMSKIDSPLPHQVEETHTHNAVDTTLFQNGVLNTSTVVTSEPSSPTPPDTQCASGQDGGEEATEPGEAGEGDGREQNSVSSEAERRDALGRRKSSVMMLSRAALSAVIPGRQHMATQLRERQATITFAIIFTNLVLTQIPLFFLSTTRRESFFPHIPTWVHLLGVNLFLLAPVLEPFIIMRNRDFKKVLTKMFRQQRHSFSLSNSVIR